MLVPGQHDLQSVRVPPGAKPGMMLSVQVPKVQLEAEEVGEGAGKAVGAGEEDDIVVEVEEDAEIVEEDVVFTWSHFFLLILFLGIGTLVMFYFIKGGFIYVYI